MSGARLKEAGFGISHQATADPTLAKQTRENYSAAKEATEDARATRIANAPDVDEEEAERIRRARTATQQEQDAAEKATITHFYGVPLTPDLVREDERGRLRPKVHLLAVHLLARRDEDRAALMPDVNRLRQGLTARVKGRYIGALLLPRFLTLYGVPAGTDIETYTGVLAPAVGFQQRVKPILVLLRRFLGVSHRPLTARVRGEKKYLADVDPIHLLSRVLACFGLFLSVTKSKVSGKTVRTYTIDTARAVHRVALAQATCKRLRDALADMEAEAADTVEEVPGLTPDELAEILGGTTPPKKINGGSATLEMFQVDAAPKARKASWHISPEEFSTVLRLTLLEMRSLAGAGCPAAGA